MGRDVHLARASTKLGMAEIIRGLARFVSTVATQLDDARKIRYTLNTMGMRATGPFVRPATNVWSRDMMNWREDLQQQIDLNNSMQAMSLIRIGDEVTEYAPCLDGAGRPRNAKEDERHE